MVTSSDHAEHEGHTLKIAIAAWHLQNLNVGIGRYVRGLINAVANTEAPHQYVILLPDHQKDLPARPHLQYCVVRIPLYRRRVWEQLAPLAFGRYDVLHLPYDSCVAWKRGKLVVTIHDVKPVVFATPSSGLPHRRLLERVLIPDPWKRIDHVITDSFCSRQDILSRLPVAVSKVSVVYPGIDLKLFRPLSTTSANSKHASQPSRVGSRPYVLCVGGADPTKNVTTLVKAFAALPPTIRGNHDLLLVGDFRRRSEVATLVAEAGIEKQTIFSGIVTDEVLIEYYRQARLCVVPSLYEGFGYPVVEAMACGCPVISSNTSSLPEVAGDAAVLVNPTDVAQLSDKMERLLSDSDQRVDLRERGLKQAERFSWERAVKEMIAVYERVGQG